MHTQHHRASQRGLVGRRRYVRIDPMATWPSAAQVPISVPPRANSVTATNHEPECERRLSPDGVKGKRCLSLHGFCTPNVNDCTGLFLFLNFNAYP